MQGIKGDNRQLTKFIFLPKSVLLIHFGLIYPPFPTYCHKVQLFSLWALCYKALLLQLNLNTNVGEIMLLYFQMIYKSRV